MSSRAGSATSTDLPQSSQPIPVPPAQARTLLNTFTTFLTITIHSLLYHRSIYPRETFLLARSHNLPVHQSRHPGLCTWINDAVAQVTPLLAHGRLSKVCVNLHLPRTMAVVERWVFDVSSFPVWIDEEAEQRRLDAANSKGFGGGGGGSSTWRRGADNGNGKGKGKEKERERDARPKTGLTWDERERRERKMQRGANTEVERDRIDREAEGVVNWADVDESVRGALRRISYAAEVKGPLPEGSTFTVAVELRDGAAPPADERAGGRDWIPAANDGDDVQASRPYEIEPALGRGRRGGKATTPLRSVRAGPMFFECWVEEDAAQDGESSARNDGGGEEEEDQQTNFAATPTPSQAPRGPAQDRAMPADLLSSPAFSSIDSEYP